MQEIWKDIKGYEGLYQVSNLGRVKSLRRWAGNQYSNKFIKREKILKHSTEKGGYYHYTLRKDGKETKGREHRLVAEAFIPNPNNYPCINHKDENIKNNNVNNLEWCTYKYNNNYGKHKERQVKSHKPFKKTIVLQYNLKGNFIKEWDSIKEAEDYYKTSKNTISQCCKGLQKTAGGFVWRYKY